jgi:DNA-binding NarL/FixJ family response regulator
LNGIRVALIDSDEMVRSGRSLLIQSSPDLSIVFESADPEAALETIADYLIDVLVIDSRIPGLSISEYLQKISNELTQVGNQVSILVTSPFESSDLALASYLSGAVGIASQDRGAEFLLRQIRSLASGTTLPSREALEALLDASAQPLAINQALAIARERMDATQTAVIKGLIQGYSDAQLAKDLGLTKYRITKFIETLCESLGFRTRIQLALAVLVLERA